MYHIFAIKCEKSGSFSVPNFSRSPAEMIRSMIVTARQKKADFALFPADFSLWRIGIWHEETGIMTMLDTYEHMLNCVTLVSMDPENHVPPVSPAPKGGA